MSLDRFNFMLEEARRAKRNPDEPFRSHLLDEGMKELLREVIAFIVTLSRINDKNNDEIK